MGDGHLMFGLHDKTHERRRLLRLLCLVTLSIVSGCEIPQGPGELYWDVDLNVPFGTRTYGIWELADPDTTLRREGSGVGMEEDSSVYFSAWANLSAGIGDSLYVREIALSIDRHVTAIEVPLDYDTLLFYSLGTLNPQIGSLHGTTQDIPQHNLQATTLLPLPAGYDSLEVDTGRISLIVANRLPYSVQDVTVRAGHVVVATFDELASDQQRVTTASLGGVTQYGVFALSLQATGSGGSQITIDSTDRISVTATIDTVTASQFYGIIPEQTVTRDSALAIEQQHHIDLVVIESGTMTITLGNHTQFADTVILKIPNLVSRLNDTLVVSRFLMPGDSDVVVIPLAQYRLRPEGDNEQTITGELTSHTPSPDDRREFVSGEERVFGRIQIERLSVEYFDGSLNNLELTFDSLSIDIERPPQGWEVVRPLEVEARIHVDHGIGGVLSSDVDAVTWLNGSQVGTSTIHVENLELEDSSVTIIPGLADLLAEYPDLLTADGNATLSGEVAVFNNTEVSLALELRAALAVIITDTLEPVGTVEKVEPGDLEDIQSGEAIITLWNHLPVGGRCYLVADYDSLNVIENSEADVDTLFDVNIPEPTIVSGRAVNASRYEFSIELNERWINYFKSDGFFVRTQIQVDAIEGDTLIVHGSDYLNVHALAKVRYTVDPGEVR